MTSAHQYHRPRPPDLLSEGSDSDLELDLDELDTPSPATSSRPHLTDRGSTAQAGSIPLQRLGDSAREDRPRGQDGETHDLETDLDDENDPLYSDNEPLLSVNLAAKGKKRGTSPPASRRKLRSNETSRTFAIGRFPPPRFPPNAVSNAKYSAWSFMPRTLYNEFSFFFNMYFLLVALSQIIPSLRIGYLSTYIAPLIFVLAITLGKEALDDIARRRRDAEANKEEYTLLRLPGAEDHGKGRSKHSTADRDLQPQKWRESQRTQYRRLQSIKEEEEILHTASRPIALRPGVQEVKVKARDLKVGDVLKLEKDQRVPADMVILKTYQADLFARQVMVDPGSAASGVLPSIVINVEAESTAQNGETTAGFEETRIGPRLESSRNDDGGEAFIRTDQLDGETDWKLRLATSLTQKLDPRDFTGLCVEADRPSHKVHEFLGTIRFDDPDAPVPFDSMKARQDVSTSLTVDNTAWANTVLASNVTVLAVVVYTGAQTRQALSTAASRSKSGLLEYEINNLTKILCALTLTLSVALVVVRGAEGRAGKHWYVAVLRFLVLFSTIVPISLRVNLDMGKTVYARFIERDNGIPGTVVRTSTIPEELGRIEYLLSDKTGTLTQNEMDLKKIHVGTVSYANEAMDEVRSHVRHGFFSNKSSGNSNETAFVTPSTNLQANTTANTRSRRDISSRVRDLVLALALCHNVTPTAEEVEGKAVTSYQASSPDEIAIVRWTESVGLRLLHRDRKSISLQSTDSQRTVVKVNILETFPFTSTSKRMGIILRFFESPQTVKEYNEVWFFEKGADTVMAPIVVANDWLEEETANMAREGLRTLVIGRKRLSEQQYGDFTTDFKQASMSLHARDTNMAKAVATHLEHNLELLGVTGVEDKLQREVKPSLELLRNAGVKIWMLTGDKVETARCVAVSAKLVSRMQYIHTVTQLSSNLDPATAQDTLSILRSKSDSTALLIDGDSLSYLLNHHRTDFISVAVLLPAVIACRCSPTQKADIAYLIREFTGKRVACIGDGGNDVSMIQAADVGIGIVGKEGRQASLAADFSITQFHHLTKLLVWHGRNSYKRSAKLAQFVIHRGLIISVCQTFYSIANRIEPHALYRDWLLVGYATVYTMAPVFSLVLDKDVDESVANLYPELYKELRTGKSLSYRTFFVWVAVSLYQGAVIQVGSQVLVDLDSTRMIAVSFSVLVLNELVMVAFEITTWHWMMYVSILGTALIYVGSIPFLGDYFDLAFMWSLAFAWRVAAISALSLIPPYSIKLLRRTLHPPNYRKVQGM